MYKYKKMHQFQLCQWEIKLGKSWVLGLEGQRKRDGRMAVLISCLNIRPPENMCLCQFALKVPISLFCLLSQQESIKLELSRHKLKKDENIFVMVSFSFHCSKSNNKFN